MKQDTPEDKLLNLIKGKYKSKTTAVGNVKQAGRTNTQLALFFSKVFLDNKLFKPSYLKVANLILVVVLIGLLVWLVVTFMVPPKMDIVTGHAGQAAHATSDPDTPVQNETGADSQADANVSAVVGKNIFGTVSGQASGQGGQLGDSELAKRFSLVGIMEGDAPQAIIEDTTAQKTYYVIKGQTMGGITVTDIVPGKVIINFEGKEIILVL